MDKHFCILRAEEEISCLNIEICRVITHLGDEARYLQTWENELRPLNPTLAYHVEKYRLQHGCFDALHMQCFRKLAQIQSFTGTLVPGDAVDTSLLSGVRLNISIGPAGMMDVDSDPQASGALVKSEI